MGTDTLPDSPIISSELPKKKFSKNIVFIFIVVPIIILFVLWFLYSNKIATPTQTSLPKPDIKFEQIKYTNSKAKDRVIGLAKKAQEENESSKSYNDYQQIFIELSLVYEYNHDAKVRHALTDLRNFLSKNYTKYFNQQNFNISCFDAECAEANLSQKATEIRDEIKKITTIDSHVKNDTLREFEAASFTPDKNSQWNHLLAVYNSLASENRRVKKADVKELATKMKNFLKSEYPENYKTHERLFLDIFEL